MRAKLITHGAGIFDTYELLEMLLYYTIPYKDTNPIAKQLLHRFGSLDGVLRATREELLEVSGIGERTAELIAAVGSIEDIIGVELESSSPMPFTTYTQVGDHFYEYLKDTELPTVAVMLFDNKMRLIDTVKIGSYNYDSKEASPGGFLDAVIKTRASVIITAHSTPNGRAFPSEGDRASNVLVSNAMKAIGAVHLEHYLVSPKGYIGMINNLSSKFASYVEISRFLKSKSEAIARGAVLDPADYMPDYYSTTED